MKFVEKRHRSDTTICSLAAVAVIILGVPLTQLQGQAASPTQIQVMRLEATPLGALPPLPLAMPASRNNNYWGGRFQIGRRRGADGDNLDAFGGGIDFQFRGGSVYGVTAGYQKRDCTILGADCGSHAMYGARARLNLLTGGGLAIPLVFGEGGTTTTIGTEVGFGYAPSVAPGVNACAADMGVQFSLAGLQRTRFVTFLTPGVIWDMKCSPNDPAPTTSYTTGFGFGFQQIRSRSVDVYIGVQKIFRDGTGYRIGISATYVRLP
ncbi:MAG TPA: hypothetical protein VM939_10670 [Gemmatimonadaceae bacterium]|nr:hypothetical protein [Gemmatimonadaceae bacterium]